MDSDSGYLPFFPSFFPPLSSRLPEPPWLQLGVPVLLITSLLFPHKYRTAFIPIFVLYACLIPRYHSEDAMGTYTVAISAASALARWIDVVVGGEAEKRFWWVADEEKAKKDRSDTQREDTENLSPTEIEERKRSGLDWLVWKIQWAASLLYAVRGVGWNWQVKNVPEGPPEGAPRLPFIRKQLWKATYSWLYFDLLNIYTRYTLKHIVPVVRNTEVFKAPVHVQVLYTWIIIFQTVYSIKASYAFGSVIFVSLHLSSPSAWPPIMDSFATYGYTVRHIWGKVYHQMIRRTTSAPSIWFCRKLGLRRGGLASRYTQLYLAFVVSSFLHYIGGLNSATPGLLPMQNAMFLLQPVGITFEDAVIALGKRAGIKESAWTRNIGRLWTICWFSYSVRYGFAGLFVTRVHLPVQPTTVLEPFVGKYFEAWSRARYL